MSKYELRKIDDQLEANREEFKTASDTRKADIRNTQVNLQKAYDREKERDTKRREFERK